MISEFRPFRQSDAFVPKGLNRAEEKAASRLDHSLLAALLSDPKARARILKYLKLPDENANH
jgi:hypothetical protein